MKGSNITDELEEKIVINQTEKLHFFLKNEPICSNQRVLFGSNVEDNICIDKKLSLIQSLSDKTYTVGIAIDLIPSLNRISYELIYYFKYLAFESTNFLISFCFQMLRIQIKQDLLFKNSTN